MFFLLSHIGFTTEIATVIKLVNTSITWYIVISFTTEIATVFKNSK